MSSAADESSPPEPEIQDATLADLPAEMRAAADRAGWTELMPCQARALPVLREGRDAMVQSRTGTGKTGAFLLPALRSIDPKRDTCQALVLVPTRELARQVANEAEMLYADNGFRVLAVYGGTRYGPQFDALRKGAHLVVGTPGRVLDHLLKRSLTLDDLQLLVFDEADRMLSMGFYPDMVRLRGYLPRHHVQSAMFSATFPPYVLRLAGQFLDDPAQLSLSKDHVHVTNTQHVSYDVPAMKKDRCLVRIIETENPTSAIIFCNTRQRVSFVCTVLQRFGYDADELSSDLAQGARERVLERVRTDSLRFLVATDVAARGIDISNLSHVFQYEPPEDPEAYIHRAGRTGRAGASGTAITLIAGVEEMELKRIAKMYEIEFEKREVPTDEDVQAIVGERLTALLEAALRERDGLKTERMQRFVPLAQKWAESEEGLALLAMLLDDSYQASLHAQPAPPDDAPPERPARRDEGRGRGRDGGRDGGGGGRRGGGGRGRGGRGRNRR